MTTLRLVGFSGEIPRLLPRLLPDMAAQVASNTRMDDGALTPLRKARRAFTFPAGSSYQSIHLHEGEWLGWAGEVHAAPGPVAQSRLYFTGDGVPKVRVGGANYPLALSAPASALTATLGGTASGSGIEAVRLYAYTWVADLGDGVEEESEPCPISNEVLWEEGRTVTLSGFAAPPAGRGIVRQRIYRAQTGASGATDLFFLAERSATNTDYVDSLPPGAIQGPLPSLTWNPPPDGLKGLIALPNGMMAGFVGKDLYFSEPWRPHAWPEGYAMTMDYEIVGLGAFGSSIAVMTNGQPYLVAGTHPSNMIQEKLEENLPCLSARSIQDLGYAIAYTSPNGLVTISSGGAQLASNNLIKRKDWRRLVPATFVCGQTQGRYLASYSYVDADDTTQEGTLIIDLTGEQLFLLRATEKAEAFYYEIESGTLYFLKDGSVYEWDAPTSANELQFYRSKLYVLPRPVNFGAIMVESEDALSETERAAIQALIDEIAAANAALVASGDLGGALGGATLNTYTVGGDATQPLPSLSKFASVGVYADGRLVATVSRVNEMVRLPAGFLARQWEIEVSGDMQVSQVSLATTGAELMAV